MWCYCVYELCVTNTYLYVYKYASRTHSRSYLVLFERNHHAWEWVKKKREWNQTPLKWNVFLLSIRYNSNRFRVSKTTFFTSSSSTAASHILMNATTKYLKNSNETIYILLLVINSLFCLFMTTTTTSSMLVFFRQLIQYDKIRLCTIMTPMNIK